MSESTNQALGGDEAFPRAPAADTRQVAIIATMNERNMTSPKKNLSAEGIVLLWASAKWPGPLSLNRKSLSSMKF